jgi:hypothetical protein
MDINTKTKTRVHHWRIDNTRRCTQHIQREEERYPGALMGHEGEHGGINKGPTDLLPLLLTCVQYGCAQLSVARI